jgi:Domain of unknown function (DUF4281)
MIFNPLPVESLFSIANATALAAWIILIFLPRTRWTRRLIQTLAIGSLCLLYSVSSVRLNLE